MWVSLCWSKGKMLPAPCPPCPRSGGYLLPTLAPAPVLVTQCQQQSVRLLSEWGRCLLNSSPRLASDLAVPPPSGICFITLGSLECPVPFETARSGVQTSKGFSECFGSRCCKANTVSPSAFATEL